MSYLSYSKSRPFIIVFLVLGTIYNVFFLLEDNKLEKLKSQLFTITGQYCQASKNSSVSIEFKSKSYRISMSNAECPKYPIGSKISLVYNDKYDYFYQQDGLKTSTFKLFFFSFLLFLSIIPWDRLLKKKRK